ncbi:unnamed protein product [Cyprideis torosa]|uniref:Octanoyl-[acyl-carrier-protein]:protein N-octanoyltransferase LIPT2, mitochondrial n=1 Tax=Cyprideis torosa TaxID=163714 RepID=A0A7R8ZWF5_9CRUS|nr:unnamed protein product [Cyprideis torosa]CAG0905159.1 unnamed protein product [Cyprideis torosa]
MRQTIHFKDLGAEQDYLKCFELQQKLQQELIELQNAEKDSKGYLLFLEHPHIYTLGKSGDLNHLLVSKEELEKLGATFVPTNRGGDITYHGPGQLVGYPIMDLHYFKQDIGWYMRQLEEVIIRTIEVYGLKGERSEGETGVWLDVGKPYTRKIAQLGVKLSKWVSLHGFALNANIDLNYFNYIIPCGIRGKAVSSLEKELGRRIDMDELKENVKHHFQSVFDVELTDADTIEI